jgi:hypothetical protein
MTTRLTLNKIPTQFLQWLVSSRMRFLGDMKDGKPLKYFSAHLPVMATWLDGERFPVNMTVKGIGLLPKKELLEYYTDVFESVIAEAKATPWNESMKKRIGAVGRLYGDIENFDPSVLGGLEIFEGKAFENLRGNPNASLLYMGMSDEGSGIQYMSFQINGSVEILDKESPYYRFLLASRRLFEFDKFHLYQPDYPFGYLIRVCEARDKSPWSRPQKPADK